MAQSPGIKARTTTTAQRRGQVKVLRAPGAAHMKVLQNKNTYGQYRVKSK